MKVTQDQISSFLQSESIAIAGVSRNPKKFGRIIYDELKKKGYNVIPINPTAEDIDGQKCYNTIDQLPVNTDALIIATPKTQTDQVLQDAFSIGLKNIWVQNHSNTKNTIKIAEENNQQIIYKKCIFMFAEPVSGVHKFHRTLTNIFGQLPH